jgi:hypothetical protein
MALPAGVPEWPKGAGCKPAGSAFRGSNPLPCTPVRFRFRLGKSDKLGRLTPEQGAVLKRLEAGEITADEAAKELDGTAHSWTWSFGTGSNESSKPAAEAALTPSQPAEDDPANALVERIAREVDTES